MQSLSELHKLCAYASKKHVCVDKIAPPQKPVEKRQLAVDSLWEVIQFFSFQDCARSATVSKTFQRLIKPRLDLRLELLVQQIQETQRKLDETNKEIEERRVKIADLNGHIGEMTDRLVGMDVRLTDMNRQIADSRDRIEVLLKRVRALK